MPANNSTKKQQLANKLINRVKDFPPLPAFVSQIMELNADPGSSLDDIARLVEAEVSLATAVIKMANSPLFGAFQPVGSISHALTMLGRKEVMNLVLARGLLQTMKGFKQKKKQVAVLRRHCFHCAITARWLATKAELPGGDFFVAGLVHDLGKIIIYFSFSEEVLAKLYHGDPANHDDIGAEEKQLGVGHTFLGQSLLATWMFPTPLQAAVEFHHEPDLCKEYGEYPILISGADILVRLLGLGEAAFVTGNDLAREIVDGPLNWLLLEYGIVINQDNLQQWLDDLREELEANEDLSGMFDA